jgi:hypothetical protein
MSLSSSFGGDLEGIGEEVIDTDELEDNVVSAVNKNRVRRQSSGLLKLRRSLHKIAQLYDPENDKTVVSINVAVRCRPFSEEDRLAFFVDTNETETSKKMNTNGGGELRLLNLDGKFVRQTRYGFTYAWWSAFNYEKYLKEEDDIDYAKKMHVTSQYDVYEHVGRQAMSDLIHGHSVVMFAYGLSGSGKTYTVFGPDDPLAPEAWFKHKFIHEQWGLFPRVAFHLFAEKKKHEGWRVTIKYFQNVVNTVRDLLSPSGEEKSDKTGLHKDNAGFMDVTWASKVVVNSWEDLRKIIQTANTRKAISPTQFNHQSTRGHCILIMEVETTNSTHEKQKGRLYVCDLAGAEPAGDIVYAQYKKNKNGEDVYVGKHPDESKTKALRAQGQKINLSLSEMTNFFRKMAAAVKSKRLKPGQSIPGCNNYFLGRFLKETMLKSKTYLFCAVRPETKFINYTISTLQFAATASIVRLKPKKPLQRKMTKHELKLYQELQQLKQKFIGKGAHLGDGRSRSESSANLLNDLHAKRQELDKHHIDNFTPEEIARKKREEAQKQMLQSKGIEMASVTTQEKNKIYFINIEEDEFLSKRYIYPLKKQNNKITTFGIGGDVEPTVNGLVANHCSFKYSAQNDSVTLIGGKGVVIHNGDDVVEGNEVELKHYDRVIVSKLVLLFFNNTKKDESSSDTTITNDSNAGISTTENVAAKMPEPTIDFIWKEFEQAVTRRNQAQVGKAFNPVLLNLQSKMRELNDLLALFGRDDSIEVELFMEEELDEDCLKYSNNFRCRAKCREYQYTHKLDEIDLDHCLAIFYEEKQLLKDAFENGRSYTVPETHDPFHVLFDHPQRMGFACVDISVPDDQRGATDFKISPEHGVPIYPLTKEDAQDTIGNVFLTVTYGHVTGASTGDTDTEDEGNNGNANQALSCSISIYHANINDVVRAIDGRYKFEEQLYEFHGHFSPGAEEGNDPDFDYSEQHIFAQGEAAQEKLYINFYTVPKRNSVYNFPISTENQRILRSFELHNEIGVGQDGESLYDKNFQLSQEVQDLKKKLIDYKLKSAMAKTKNDASVRRYDARIKGIENDYKRRLQEKCEEITGLKARKAKELQGIIDLKEKLTKEKTMVTQAQHDLENIETHLEVTRKELEVTKGKLVQKENEKREMSLKIISLEKKFCENEETVRMLRKNQSEQLTKASTLRSRIEFLNAERAKLHKDIEEAHFQSKQLEFTNKSHIDAVKNVEKDFDSAKEVYKKTLQSKMGEVASLYEEIMEKNSKLASLGKKIQLAEEKNNLLQKRLNRTLAQKTNNIIYSYNVNTEVVEKRKSEIAFDGNESTGMTAINVKDDVFKQEDKHAQKTLKKFMENSLENDDDDDVLKEKSAQVFRSKNSGGKQHDTKTKTAALQSPSLSLESNDSPPSLASGTKIPVVAISSDSNASVTTTTHKKNYVIQRNATTSFNDEVLGAMKPLINCLSVHNLENIFREIQGINVQASKDIRSILHAIISASMLAESKSHLYIALMVKLFARSVVTKWQQRFIRTGLVNGEYFWQDGVNGQTFGPFFSSIEALKHAVRETNPKALLHQLCLKKLESSYVRGINTKTVTLVTFMSKLFDHKMLPATVMQQLLIQLVDDSNNKVGNNDGGNMLLISAILEIAYRCLMAGSIKLGNNVVTYLKSLKHSNTAKQLSRRDTFLIRKLLASIHLSGFEAT